MYLILLVQSHIVSKIVKAELIVCAIGYVSGIGGLFLGRCHSVNDQSYGHAQVVIELTHPLTVTSCQIVVYRDHVDAVTGQSVQVCRKCCDKSFSFTCLHLGDVVPVKSDAAGDLNREVLHLQYSVGGLSADCKSVRQDIIRGLAVGKSLLEYPRLSLELIVAHGMILALEAEYLVLYRLDLLEFLGFIASE